MTESEFIPEIIELPIDGVLDLHMFSPKDASDVVQTWLQECLDHQIYEVRIIHGKGVGVLARIVESVLKKHPQVESFHTASPQQGGWGATVAHLKAPITGQNPE